MFDVGPAFAIYGSWLLFTRLYYGTVWPQVLSLPPDSNPRPRCGGDVRPAMHARAGPRACSPTGVLAFLFTPRTRDAVDDTGAAAAADRVGGAAARAVRGARSQREPRHLLLIIPVIHWLAWRAVDVVLPRRRVVAVRTVVV